MTTMTSADSPVFTGVSPGKASVLRSIPAASTWMNFGCSSDFDVLCHLIHSSMPRYAVPVRQYRPLQSRLLQCMNCSIPPCGLLRFPDAVGARRDFHPLDSFYSKSYICHSGHTQRVCASGGAMLRLTILCIFEMRFFVSSEVVKSPPATNPQNVMPYAD